MILENLDFTSRDDANTEINKKKEFWNRCGGLGKCSLYWYDSKTTPDDLDILKLTIEKCNE